MRLCLLIGMLVLGTIVVHAENDPLQAQVRQIGSADALQAEERQIGESDNSQDDTSKNNEDDESNAEQDTADNEQNAFIKNAKLYGKEKKRLKKLFTNYKKNTK